MGQLSLVLPEMDVLLRAFGRADPDPGAVREFTALTRERRIFLVGWVRQGLLTRCTDDRQFQRLQSALAPFPDLGIRPPDHVAAAHLTRQLRERGGSIQAAQSLLWIMAERASAEIWTREALSVRDRRLLTMGVIAALGEGNTWAIQVKAALKNGELSAEQVREALLHLAQYAGYPRAAGLLGPTEAAIAEVAEEQAQG